ncbi:MAG TPA: acyl carrier protein [Burkholderiales bacterium]|nr:acyl carrier protein [Burkholderiales bacterium]
MNTLDELKQLINTTFGIDPATLKPDAPLAEYGLDSLSLAELVFTIDEHFNIDIPDSRTEVNTLAGLASLIDELRAAQPA